MKLCFAGVNHRDPLGPSFLRARYRHWLNDEGKPPEFVAVEYAQPTFAAIRLQRQQFRHLVEQQWPDLPLESVNQLVQALGYEGDAHEDIFPGVEVLWLERDIQGRNTAEAAKGYATGRLAVYRSLLQSDSPKDLGGQFIEAISRSAWAGWRSQETQYLRDEHWERAFLSRTNLGEEGWAAIVVGASHLVDCEGSIRQRLEDQGFDCTIALLDPLWK